MRRLAGLAVVVALVAPACDRGGDPTVRGSFVPSTTPSAPVSAPGSVSPTPSPAPSGHVTDAYPKQTLRWSSCGDGFQCATLKVPLDYTKPTGRRIDVSVIRLPASGVKARRIGSLLLNPGGPGGSGVDFGRQARSLFTREIRARFDVVGFDPRGVGRSTPVRCVDSARELDRILHADPDPDTAAERRQLVSISREQAEGCGRKFGWLLPHITTLNTARDMEVLRRALGDPKLTYIGFSYGTVLGALYAEQFPDRVRALVLDGAVDLALEDDVVALEQAAGFEKALDAFLTWCRSSRSCAFGPGGDVRERVAAVLRRVERSPLPAGGRRTLGPSEALFGIAAGLYSRDWGWPALGKGLKDAENGDGRALIALFDNLVDRRSDGSYSNAAEALVAISCVDGEYPTDLSAYDADAAAFERRAPRFGAAIAYGGLACAFWPRPALTRATGPVRAPGTPPVLVIGTTGDPATPYAWSQAMARQFPRGVLLTYRGEGHTAYGFGRASCIERWANDYLISLKVPPAGTTC